MRYRANYSVAATVVVLMVLLAFTASIIRPFIPGPPPNPIATYPGDYMKQASAQRIGWHPIDANAFAEARRLDRPVLLFIGVAWSQAARDFDSEVLSAAGVENYLAHNFVCVRIDGDETPAWVSAYLPISRASLGIRPRFQIWILEPDGRLVANVGRWHLDQNMFLDELVRIRHIYTQMRQQNLTSDVDAQQLQDIASIESAGSSPMIDFDGFQRSLIGAADLRNGSFPQTGFQRLYPFAWEFLAQTGATSVLRGSLRPALQSPIADLMDGGFFFSARSRDWRTVEFDKSSVLCAEMGWMLTQVGPQLDEPTREIAEYLVRRTVASLTGEFIDDRGFVRVARIGDDSEDGRSSRTSVPPRRMRDALDAKQRDWARKNLGLRVETNPEMVPFLSFVHEPDVANDILIALKKDATTPRFTEGEFMDVNATVAARLMEVGRAIHDSRVVDFGSNLFSRLDSLRVSDQVPHDLDVGARAPATLGDYLAFSDAALQDYLSSGRVVSLQQGLAVLQRGLATYAGPNPGEFRVGLPPSSDLIPSESVTAQLVDDLGESTSAKVLRLCTSYGRLMLGDASDSDQGVLLLRTAYATSRLLAQPAGGLGVSGAGFAAASATLADDEYAIAVGPKAQELGDQLYGLRPMRFVAAAFGPVRPDLRDKTPGIYIVREGHPFGPYTVGESAGLLTPTLKVR